MTSKERLSDVLRQWDRLGNAVLVMHEEGIDFGEILTRRGQVIENLIDAAREVVGAHETGEKS
jgi:hypothetical protein